MHEVLIRLAKVAISAGLIGFTFNSVDSQSAFAQLGAIPPAAAALAVALLLVQHVVGGIRFHRLMSRMSAPIDLRTAVDSVFIGVFFGQVFATFIGGDAMRIWRMTGCMIPAAKALEAIVFDRMLGFVALIVLILAGLPLFMGYMPDESLRWSLLSVLLAMTLGIALLLLARRLPDTLQRWRTLRVASQFSGLALSVISRPGDAVYLLGTSLIIQLMNVVVVYIIAVALHANVQFLDFVILIPPVMLLAMLPISFAGWGVREGAMAVTLGLVGVNAEQSVAISVLFGLSLIASGLPGGFFWLASRRSDRT